MVDERLERFLADVMFHSFRVPMRDAVRDAQRFEELEDDLMASTRFLRESSPGVGQLNGTIRSGADEANALETLDGPIHGDMGDPQATSQIRHARLAGGRNEFGDQFQVIQGNFLRVLFPGMTGVTFQWRGSDVGGLSRRPIHGVD